MKVTGARPANERPAVMPLQIDAQVCTWRCYLEEEELKTRQGGADTLTVWRRQICAFVSHNETLPCRKSQREIFLLCRSPTSSLKTKTLVLRGDDYYQRSSGLMSWSGFNSITSSCGSRLYIFGGLKKQPSVHDHFNGVLTLEHE